MLAILLATILVLAIAFFQVIQGLFSALIMTILTIVSAALAFTYYEPLAELMYTRQPGYADAVALVAVFFIALLVLRLLYDKFLGQNVLLGLWADRIGGGILGLISAMIMVGVLTISVQMLPFGTSVLGYQPFDVTLKPQGGLALFYPDEFTMGLMNMLSSGSLKGERPFQTVHEDLRRELFAARNTAEMNSRSDASPDALTSLSVYQAPELRLAPWRDELPDNPLLDASEITQDFIVRCQIDGSARDESTEQDPTQRYYLPGTHFRLVTQSGQSYYPVAYLTFGVGARWQAHTVANQDGQAELATLVVCRPFVDDLNPLTVDWVYRIPKDQIPRYVVFRRVAKQAIPKIITGPMPNRQKALDNQGIYKEQRPSRRRR